MVATRLPVRRQPADDPSARRPRATRVVWPALTALTAFAALFAALAIGGGAAPDPDGPGALVQFGRPVTQLVLNLAASGALGALVLASFAARPGVPTWDRLLDGAAACAGVWTVAAAAAAFLLYLTVSPPITSPSFGPNLVLFLTGIETGRNGLAAVIAAALLTALLIAVRSHTGVAVMTVACAAALIPLALQGHVTTAAGDHNTAVLALALHIIAAAAWLGGLAVLYLLGRTQRGTALADLAGRYSAIALVCFVVVGASGVASAAIRVGSLAGLASPYGGLLLVKTVTLVAAGALGAVHRTVTIRRIASGAGRVPFLRLVAVELLVLAVAVGFAAGLTATPTPELVVQPKTTPAELLTGSPLPPPLTAASLLGQWKPDLVWILVCGFLAAFYLAGVRRLRRRGDAWPVHRTILWLSGVAVLFWVTNGGLNRYQQVLFSAHMMAHMTLAMLVPLLLVPAAPVTLALRAVPKRTDGTRGVREWLLLAVHSRLAAVLSNPLVAAVLFAGSLVVFYYSPLFRWATTDHIGHQWMTVHFLVTGYLFVQSMIGADPVPFRFPYPIRLIILLATMAFHAFFGLALILGSGVLLADWYGAMGWGTSALVDQRAGGGIAWSVGEIPTLMLAVAVAVSWARSDDREAKRGDRQEDRSGDADLTAYNEMLGRLGGRA